VALVEAITKHYDDNKYIISSSVYYAFDLSDARIYGDLNDDWMVDRTDINIIRRHINQPKRVCPECDINSDGTIDIKDVRKLVMELCTNDGCR
jgi:hypothetical protein